MACRIPTADFRRMAEEEAAGRIPIVVSTDPQEGITAQLVAGDLVFHKKPIQALVDAPEEARPIIRNLIRWGIEERDKALAVQQSYGALSAVPWWRRVWR